MTSTIRADLPLLVADTSVFVGVEQRRPVGPLPPGYEVVVTVVTLAELHLGVLNAPDPAIEAQRLLTFLSAWSMRTLDIDRDVAEHFAGLVRHARLGRRSIGVQDAWIAAIAVANGAAVATQDDDFDHLPVEVIKV